MSDTPPLPPELRVPPAPPEAPPPPPPPAVEDASAQALAEAFGSSFKIVKFIMAVLVLVFLCSGMFVVQPNERAVVLLFGKPMGVGEDRLKPPGWHWAWPYPINEIVRIPIGQIQTATSTAGWYATTPEMEARNEEPQAIGMLSPEADGYTLSADGNIIHAKVTLKYRIEDPLRFTFGFENAREILTNVLNNALFYTSARITADSALYRDKAGFRDTVLERVRQKVAELNLGIALEPSDVETKAPADVVGAFKAVNEAEQKRSEKISLALGDRDLVLSKAKGEADAVLARAVGSSNRLLTTVTADATAFRDQLPEYVKDPELFRSRLLAARMSRVLTNVEEKFFLPDRPDGQAREVRLLLSREPVKGKAADARQP